MNFRKIILPLILLAYSIQFAQVKTNFEIINDLVDSSAILIAENYTNPDLTYNLKIDLPREYAALQQRIITSLVKNGVKIKLDSALSNSINYSLSKVGLQYSDLSRDGLFGEYILEREFILSGEFSIKKKTTISDADTFSYKILDTIPYDNIDFVENKSLPFTTAKTPSEPFMPSIIEPVIAITTVVVTVILFFSVRSK